MTSKLTPSQQRARLVAIDQLSEAVKPSVKPEVFQLVMRDLVDRIRVNSHDEVKIDIDGTEFDDVPKAVQTFLASLPSFKPRSSDPAKRTLEELTDLGRADAFDVPRRSSAPSIDSPNPAERTLAQLRAMGDTRAFTVR